MQLKENAWISNYLNCSPPSSRHADQRFLDKSFVTSDAGRAAFEAFQEDKAAREAEEERLAAEAEDETRQFLPARNGNNHSRGSGSGGDHENGQVSDPSCY